jgi:CheY-like chemotaxis protein
MILKMHPDAMFHEFVDPENALIHIRAFHSRSSDGDTIIFLDINMPIINGWEFLEIFENFSPVIKSNVKIYMLSSSVDARDKQRAATNINVQDYIEKPLSIDKLSLLLKRHVA